MCAWCKASCPYCIRILWLILIGLVNFVIFLISKGSGIANCIIARELQSSTKICWT